MTEPREQVKQPRDWRIRRDEIITRPDEVAAAVLSGRAYDPGDLAVFAAPDYDTLADPMLLSGMEPAVVRIRQAIDGTQRVVVYGDYDIDGISAVALLLDGLKQFGADVQSYIPDRFEEGYGLNNEAIQTLKDAGTDLVITVDCGISSVEQVALAAKIGLDLIVTDHHTVPDEPPVGAVVLINPKLPRSKYPFRELAGVGVAFALIRALQQAMPTQMPPGQEKWLLDLVALGTICDQVPLVGENWLMARYGIEVLRKTRRPGLRALMAAAGTQPDLLDEGAIGFRLGPRLNAAGRIEHANLALRLLTTTSPIEARRVAEQLNLLNQDRQRQTQTIYDEALARAREQDQPVVVLADPSWSHGIVGIVASRVSETLHKPTILFQVEGEGESAVLRGSARSVGDFDIIAAITVGREYLQRFGGHQFAAGMTLQASKLDDFHQVLNRQYEQASNTDRPPLEIDAQLAAELLSDVEAVQALDALRPFGKTHPQPLFMSRLRLAFARPVGDKQQHIRLGFEAPDSGSVSSKQRPISAIYFGGTEAMADFAPGDDLEVVYNLEINHWQDRHEPQLVITSSPHYVS